MWLSGLLAFVSMVLFALYAAWATVCGIWCAIREPKTFPEFAIRGLICMPLAVIVVLAAGAVADRWPHLDYDIRRFIVVFSVSAALVGVTWSAIRWPRTWRTAGARAALVVPVGLLVAAAVHLVATKTDRDDDAACRRDAAGIDLRGLSFSPSESPTVATVSLALPADSRDITVDVRGDEGIEATPESDGTLGPLPSPAPSSLRVPLKSESGRQPTHWRVRVNWIAHEGRLVTVEYDTAASEERRDKGLCWTTRPLPPSVRLR